MKLEMEIETLKKGTWLKSDSFDEGTKEFNFILSTYGDDFVSGPQFGAMCSSNPLVNLTHGYDAKNECEFISVSFWVEA